MLSAFNIIIKGHAAAGNMDGARKAFAAMSARGLAPDAVTYNTLLCGFVRGGDMAAAQSLVRTMRLEGVAPDVWTYSTLALGWGRLGQLQQMWGVVQDMQQAGIQPNSVSVALVGWGWVCDITAGRAVLSIKKLVVVPVADRQRSALLNSSVCTGCVCACHVCVCRPRLLLLLMHWRVLGRCSRQIRCCSSCWTTAQT